MSCCGSRGGLRGSRVCGLWVGRAWQNPDLTHLLIPMGGLRSGGFNYSMGVTENCGWGPRAPETQEEAGLICPLKSHLHHDPISLCLPLSTSTPLGPHLPPSPRPDMEGCPSQPGLRLVPKGKAQHEHLAPTICASITQFNSVVNSVDSSVITTCLGDLSMTAIVLEH